MHFDQSVVNPCIFHRYWDEPCRCPVLNTTYPAGQQGHIVLYVDNDMSGFTKPSDPNDTHNMLSWFTIRFKQKFGVSDAGADDELNAFIGMSYSQAQNAISIRCPTARRRLRETMAANNVQILSDAISPLPENALALAYAPADSNTNPIIPDFPAKSIVGSSSFLAMSTEPFAAFPCCLLSQFATPGRVTRNVAFLMQWHGSWLASTDRPIIYRRGDGNAEVTTLSDASWANKPDMTNFHGWMQLMCGAAFDWRAFSGRQVHSSTRGAELLTSIDALHALIGVRTMLFEYRVGPQGPMTLGMDSKATISGAKKDNISKKSRHEAIRIAIIRQATKDWIIAPTYRNTANMDADVLTKPLTMANPLYFYPRVYGVI